MCDAYCARTSHIWCSVVGYVNTPPQQVCVRAVMGCRTVTGFDALQP